MAAGTRQIKAFLTFRLLWTPGNFVQRRNPSQNVFKCKITLKTTFQYGCCQSVKCVVFQYTKPWRPKVWQRPERPASPEACYRCRISGPAQKPCPTLWFYKFSLRNGEILVQGHKLPVTRCVSSRDPRFSAVSTVNKTILCVTYVTLAKRVDFKCSHHQKSNYRRRCSCYHNKVNCFSM